jgi:4-amino-4-deoxy-L-arabinose transferase-like glycosyltransferase
MTISVLEDQRTVWIILVISFVLFLIGNLPWHLDDYDQAKQAFTSFEMIKEGRWFYQQTPHEHVATKPPLVGWVSAGLFGLTRSWELSWRLPSLLAAIGLAIFLFRAASSAYRPIGGLMALGAFGLNLLSPRLATLVRTDMPLALMIFLVGMLIWKKIKAGTEWTPRDQVYLFALLTVAMLIKGPIVYAFLLPGIALFQWRYGRARPPGAWPGWWPWIASLAVFLLWVMGGILFQSGFFDEVVMREFVCALWRNNPSTTTALFLLAASAAQVCSMERVDDRYRARRTSFTKMAAAFDICRDVTRDFLAAFLESGRINRDVTNSLQTR